MAPRERARTNPIALENKADLFCIPSRLSETKKFTARTPDAIRNSNFYAGNQH
jgi:hypothetical protein